MTKTPGLLRNRCKRRPSPPLDAMPFGGLAFFADAGNGDQFFVSLGCNNAVYVWEHESDSRTWLAATVLGYLEAWMRGELSL